MRIMNKLYFDYNWENNVIFRFIIKHDLDEYGDLSLHVRDSILDRENKIVVIGYTYMQELNKEIFDIQKFNEETFKNVKNMTINVLDPTGITIKSYKLVGVSLKEMVGNTAIYNFKECLEEEFIDIDKVSQ